MQTMRRIGAQGPLSLGLTNVLVPLERIFKQLQEVYFVLKQIHTGKIKYLVLRSSIITLLFVLTLKVYFKVFATDEAIIKIIKNQ